MSRLDELIEELCPEGVIFSKIDELCTITRGRVMSKDYIRANQGEYPVYSSQTENNGELGKISTFDYEGEYLTWTTDGANAGSVFYRNGKFSVTNVCGLLNVKFDKIIIRYLYYSLLVTAPKHVSRGMGNPKLMSTAMGKIKIPVPPIEIQKEIVRILDNYTELNTKLISELKLELEARRNQYECYRDKLLSFSNEVECKKLEEISIDMYRGSGIRRDQVTESGTPCVRYGEIYTSYNIWFDKCISYTDDSKISNGKYFEHGDILFAITGESVKDISKSCVYMGEEKCLAGGDIVIMKHNQNPKYLSYALSTTNAQIQKSKGKVKNKVVHSSVPDLKKIEIPVPSIEEQQRIVDILDKYANLYKDISTQIKAEIEARQKQYEYYRDKLLTFKIKE